MSAINSVPPNDYSLPLQKDANEDLYQASNSAGNNNYGNEIFAHPNNSNSSNISNYLNIPDEYRGTSIMNNYNYNYNVNGQDDMGFFDAMEVDDQERPNPFTEYANPDQIQDFSSQNSQYPTAFPAFPPQLGLPNKRHRIMVLEEESENKKKEDEYSLFNPNIEPSHMINDVVDPNSIWSEDFLFVPQTSQEKETFFPDMNDAIIPGYENDYLLYEDFEEDAEDDISEDEDEGNYFHVDDDFDQVMMGNMNNNNYIQNIPMNELRSQMQDFQIREQPSAVSSAHASSNLFDSEEVVSFTGGDFSPELDDDKEVAYEEEASVEPEKMSAADVTAMNPNHQCDLINPSSGLPCNKQFSRPYDLIRHQETIHAPKKKIFRCVICEGRLEGGPGNGKSKTFSRGDALSRHIKVKHGLTGNDALDLITKAKENVEYISVC